VEALFKLSQEKPADVQESVIQRYEADPNGAGRPIARLMREAGMGCAVAPLADTAAVCPS
jgi:hypothetical protein